MEKVIVRAIDNLRTTPHEGEAVTGDGAAGLCRERGLEVTATRLHAVCSAFAAGGAETLLRALCRTVECEWRKRRVISRQVKGAPHRAQVRGSSNRIEHVRNRVVARCWVGHVTFQIALPSDASP